VVPGSRPSSDHLNLSQRPASGRRRHPRLRRTGVRAGPVACATRLGLHRPRHDHRRHAPSGLPLDHPAEDLDPQTVRLDPWKRHGRGSATAHNDDTLSYAPLIPGPHPRRSVRSAWVEASVPSEKASRRAASTQSQCSQLLRGRCGRPAEDAEGECSRPERDDGVPSLHHALHTAQANCVTRCQGRLSHPRPPVGQQLADYLGSQTIGNSPPPKRRRPRAVARAACPVYYLDNLIQNRSSLGVRQPTP
jgi:hypothetical protein